MKKLLLTLIFLCVCSAVGCGSSNPSSNNRDVLSDTPTYPEKEYTYVENNKETISNGLFYVSKSGNDANDGTESKPWLTIQHAADTLKAGQKVYIKEGIYNERVTVKNSGTSGSPIIFSALSGHRVILDGTGIPAINSSEPYWGGLFLINKVNYIKVKGLTIRNAKTAGIYVEQSNNTIIENNYTYNTASSGIGAWNSQNITIDGNEIVWSANSGKSLDLQENLTVAGCIGFEVRNNNVHHNGVCKSGGKCGIDAKHSYNGKINNNKVHDLNKGRGIYIDAWNLTYPDSSYIEVYNNTVYHCVYEGIGCAAENGGTLKNVKIYNNLVYDNAAIGIIVAGAKGWTDVGNPNHYLKNIYIYNNTVYRNRYYSSGTWGCGIKVQAYQGENIYIGNNICYLNYNDSIVVDNAEGAPKNLVIGSNLIGIDPLFIDPTNSDPSNCNLRLKSSSSSAINKASSANNMPVATTDFDGKTRTSADFGAFEY